MGGMAHSMSVQLVEVAQSPVVEGDERNQESNREHVPSLAWGWCVRRYGKKPLGRKYE
jgi:hypothetical protein